MTKEEALNILHNSTVYHPMYLDALNMAIKALEQEPCEDAISRQSAIFLADDLKQDLPDDEHIADMVMAHNEGILEYQTQLSLLPSVKSQQKTGHWKKAHDDIVQWWACSECGKPCSKATYGGDFFSDYCPSCGAKMEESEE